MPATKKKSSAAKPARHAAASHADQIEEQLAKYRSMRNFGITAEPKGSESPKIKNGQLPFVVQKHAATRLHYDFRLGWRGVLKSWAVTKGPSYFPGDKRLAVQVEDHPIEYGGFEGIIPKGQYGGGTVMLWDEGTWEPHGDADEGLAKGQLKFTLHGKKLDGDWVLVRMGGKAANEKKPNWLLIKEHDGKERGPDDPCVTEAEPDSVITGRSLEEIAASEDHVWSSAGSERREEKISAAAKKKSSPAPIAASNLRSAPKEKLPEFVPPELATQVSEAPEGAEWVHELKLDGYRMQARIHAGKVSLLTRSGLDWTHRMPQVADGLANLPVKTALLDGEVVVFEENGQTSFARLQAAFQEEKKQPLTYVVFDLLHLDGHNLRPLPLDERKKILEQFLAVADSDTIRYSEHLGERGGEIFANACRLGAEGILSKKISSPYVSGRGSAWLKIKCIRQQEFVIGGFTPPSKSGVGIGALLLGYYRDHELVYAGRTGTGFTQKMRLDMRRRLDAIIRAKPSFRSLPPGAAHQATWVEPRYVCEVAFATWTADNLVRQASFQGLREDKPASEVRREVPADGDEEQPTPEKKPARKSAPKKSAATRTHSLRAKAEKPSSPKSSTPSDDPFPIALTHPEKQVDTETHLTKRELADYFWAVRGSMLPYIVDRPLSIVRCPQGSTKPCFYQKHVTDNLPKGLDGIEIRGRRSGVVESYITLSTPLGLAGLAQMGVLEIHPWGSTNEDIEKPNMLIFDLDPDEAISWQTLAESAREVRARLKKLKLESFLKTTGGKGLHIIAPIEPEHDWSVVKEFAHAFANRMEAENRQLYLTKMTKAARKGKIYIDYLRNDRGATSIAPYSPRARQGAPVAVPLAWKELDLPERPRFLVADFAQWSDRLRHDPWKGMLAKQQSLSREILERFSVSGEPE